MVPFAGYGFNKSHAAAYTVVAYRTGWLKCHKPAEFMAANLTNEITSTDTLPLYIAEARRMGIPVDAPDVNRSAEIFDVVDGHIVFGLKGIKGMGEAAAAEIVKERTENGPFKDFIDFLDRVDLKTVNKKAIEVLIKTGAFDKLGKNRPTLLLNMERAVEYEENKKEGGAFGQVSLFEDSGEKEFADFKFEEAEDSPKLDKLNMEKELIGCYVSGHPLDDYKKAIETSATVNSSNILREAKESKAEKDALAASGQNSWQSRNAGKEYTAIGMITELRPIMTKKAPPRPMAFAKLQDYNGAIDLTFFPKTWEKMASVIKNEGVYAFKGKVDGSRDDPSFMVDSLEDISTLQAHSIQEVHIQLDKGFTSDKQIFALKDFLFGSSGNCSVYFHIDTEQGPYTVKANAQLSAPSTKEFIQSLETIPFVKDVWTA